MKIARIKHFLNVGIWKIAEDDKKRPSLFLLDCIRKFYLAVRFFIERGHFNYASSLAFSTMLAIVPVAAVIFAVARGFGLDDYIAQSLRTALESQPQAAAAIIDFAQSYLAHAKSGIIIGIGLVFMLYSVLSLINNVEIVFNDIWQVKEKRSPARVIIDYTALLFFVPVGIIIISGFNIFIYTIARHFEAYFLLSSATRFFIKLLTFVLMSGVFTSLYVFMPNTKVKFSKVVVPGTIAGVAMLLLQFFYIHSQIFLTSYNAIYGSFAALPLFMLWILASWYICLFCAELSYMNQYMDHYAFLVSTEDLSHERRLAMSAVLLSAICRRFADGQRPYTAMELAEITGIPIRITKDLLYVLIAVNLITENSGSTNEQETMFQPAQDIANITVGKMVELLEIYSHKKTRSIDFHVRDYVSPDILEAICASRETYLDALKDVPIKNLTNF